MTSVLVTGVTGVVGTEILAQGGRHPDHKLTATSRRGDSRRGVVAWDLTDNETPDELLQPWDVIVNAAANTRWTMSDDEAYEANVASCRALARVASEKTRLVHVSTAFAEPLAVNPDGNQLVDRHQFRNSYEWSKALSEEAARMTFGHVNIVRLPLVVGRRYDGAIARFNGLYTLLRSLQTGLAPAVIGHPDAIVEIAPADEAAEAVWSQIAEPTRSRTVVTSGGALTLGELVRAVYSALNHWRSRRQLGHLPVPPLVSPESWRRFLFPFAKEHLTARQLHALELLSEYEEYLAIPAPLDADIVIKDPIDVIASAVAH